jgi:spore maturation protein CgeB
MQLLKYCMKRIVWATHLNEKWKSAALKREYAQTQEYYSRRVIKAEGSSRGVVVTPPLNIFYLGTDEMQDRSGILQALSKLSTLAHFTREDGCYGQNYPGSEAKRRRTNSIRLIDLFREFSSQGKTPDVLIGQTWAGYIDPKVFDNLREWYGTFVINIGMDDRHQYWGKKVDGEWWGTRGLIPHIDLALTAAPECVEWYQKEGCPALFFPEGSDPEIFHPMPELPKVHDVCFVGGRYGIREKIVNSLRRAGIRVTAYGAGWEGGRLDTNDVPRLFAQSNIVLGIGTIGHCDDFYALKMRDFDGPMSGSLYLTHDNPDLSLVYKIGHEIATYRSIDDCIEKTKWFLAHDDERERIAQAGRARAFADHTWDKRFTDLFEVLRSGLTPHHLPLQPQ